MTSNIPKYVGMQPYSDFGIQSLDDHSQNLSRCTVCKMQFDEGKRTPKFLPCFHTFCLGCLNSLSSSTVIITCPLCKKTFTCNYGVENLKSNIYALHIAKHHSKIAGKTNSAPVSLECWCLTCEDLACLTCYFSSSKHSLVPVGESTLNEAEDLQKLVKEVMLKKELTIQRQKLVQTHLNVLLESLVQAEEGIKKLMMKNERDLESVLSLDEKGIVRDPKKEGLTVSRLRETMTGTATRLEGYLDQATRVVNELDDQKKIRITLTLKDTNNKSIPTSPVFEKGFYNDWASMEHTTENMSTIDRSLMIIFHFVFDTLKRWKIPLHPEHQPKSLFSTVSKLTTSANETKSGSVCSAPTLTTEDGAGSTAMSSKKMSPTTEIWSLPSVMSYSQALNQPKSVRPPLKKLSSFIDELQVSFTLTFEQTGNPKYNRPRKYLGEVLMVIKLSSNDRFTRALSKYCCQPRELTTQIIKASPGMFITVQAENQALLAAVPPATSSDSWGNSELAKDAWDVGINSVADTNCDAAAWKFIFLLDTFRPNNMEKTNLFGKVIRGQEVLQRLSVRTKHDRKNLLVNVATV